MTPDGLFVGCLLLAAAIPFLAALGMRPLFRLLNRERETAYDDAARRLGLRRGPTVTRPRLIMVGEREGFTVAVERLPVFKIPRITVEGAGGRQGPISTDFRLLPGYPFFSNEDRVPIEHTHDVVVGDQAVDDRYHFGGKPALVLALMNHESRSLLSRSPDDGESFVVENSRIQLTYSPGTQPGHEIVERVDRALRLARRFSLPASEIPGELARNVRTDPVPQVRANSLAALAERFPENAVTHSVLVEALRDADPRVRLVAAKARGDFDALARLVVEFFPEEERTGILERLATTTGRDETPERPSPSDSREKVAATALALLAAGFGRELVLPLVRVVVAAAEPGPLRLAALRALATLGDSSCEKIAGAILSSPFADERAAALDLLAAFGSAAAVGPIRAADKRKPFGYDLGSDGGRNKADAAIEKIQARLAGAAAGQVTLASSADNAAGWVSLAPAGEAGRVSLPGEE